MHLAKRMSGDFPIQVTFRGMTTSESLEANVRERARGLAHYFDRIVGVRVVLEEQHRHHAQGRLFHARIEIDIPGENVFIGHESHERHEREDPYVAVRDAFDAAVRRLEDRVHRMRDEVKTHAPATAHGVVVRISPPEDFGFIRMASGQQVYFHRNSLVGATLEGLREGARVRFTLHTSDGADGPHASGVRVLERSGA